jgi:uncharacterized protein YbgA (DUF1722 family)/uncharacterized protein YbbK (DUF523 family)
MTGLSEMDDKIKIGISRCLLGENVRYDGGHKWDRFITDTLGKYPADPRLVTIGTKIDHTDRMKNWARRRIDELEKEGLCGFIFKSGSPSSSMEGVKIYGDKGGPVKTGVGIFAREFMARFPLLPVEDEGRLHDPQLRENFIERIFALKRWRENSAQKGGLKFLINFHTSHKFLILSHSRKHYQKMGQLVAQSDALSLNERFAAYQTLFLEALRIKTTPKKHTDVLMHLMGFFKKELSPVEKQELLEIINHYKQGLIPLVVPVTLLLHYVRKYGQPYLKNQWYLEPHPLELKLRNHV